MPEKQHNGEIHSLDINSDGLLVATAGKDKKVSVWLMADILQTDAVVRQNMSPLKDLAIHESTVKFVRWNPKQPEVLISGDASGCVNLCNVKDLTHSRISPIMEPGLEKPSALDGSWSEDGKLVAWSTSDGKVHLVDTVSSTHQELIGEGTQAVQRSVSFDPTNNFLLTLGDDTFVNLYQYQYDLTGQYQFKIISKISQLMNNVNAATAASTYRRVSWSCDGEFFSVPNASKKLTVLVSLLARSKNWEHDISLVGHDIECDVVSFCPKIFLGKDESAPTTYRTQDDVPPHQLHHIIATAGMDKTLVIWNTARESPIAVLRDISMELISDLQWDVSSKFLLFSTFDGHIGKLTFDEDELGFKPAASLLFLLRNSQKDLTKPFALKTDIDVASKGKKHTEFTDQRLAMPIQTELPASSDHNEQDKADEKVVTTFIQDKEEEASSGVIIPTVLTAKSAPKSATIKVELSRTLAVPTKKSTSPKEKPLTAPPKITTKDGKKRIQPQNILNGSLGPSVAVLSNENSSATTISNPGSSLDFEKPSYSVPKDVKKEIKRLKHDNGSNGTKKIKRDLEAVEYIGSTVVNPNISFARARLSVPKVRHSFTIESTTKPLALEIRNGLGNESVPSRVTLLKNDLQIWVDFLPRFILAGTEGSEFWAVASSDGQIIVYSRNSGRRQLPPIILGSPVSFLESQGNYLLAVTCIGELYVWDIESKKLHLNSPLTLISLLDLNSKFLDDALSKAANITLCSVTSKGTPLVTLSDGSGFLYNSAMGTWNTVSEAWWAFGSHYWDSIEDEKSEKTSVQSKTDLSVIDMLEHRTNDEILRKLRSGRGKFFNKISKNMMMKEGFENLEGIVSLCHLENRILCAELLQEKASFKTHLMTYASKLCTMGLKGKLYEMCHRFLTGSEEICGHQPRDLLKEIILMSAENRESQRILVHFATELGLVEAEYE